MKPRWLNIITVALPVILLGCPYRSSYRLDAEPVLALNESYMGKWAVFVKKPGGNRAEPVKVIITGKSDMEYAIGITGYIEEMRPFKVVTGDTIKATGYLSDIDGRSVLNLFVKDLVYIVEVKMDKGKLSLLPLADHFTAKLIRSHAELRNAVLIHYKSRLRPLYDEDFVLKEMVRVN